MNKNINNNLYIYMYLTSNEQQDDKICFLNSENEGAGELLGNCS